MRSIKKLEFGQDERQERLTKKRKEILARIEASNRAKKEAELRRRAERVMNHSSLDDSAEESDAESSIVQNNTDKRSSRGGNLPQLPPQDQDDHTSIPLTASNRRKGVRSSILGGIKREDTTKTTSLPPIRSKRSTMVKGTDGSKGKENTEDSAFAFLSEWGNMGKV